MMKRRGRPPKNGQKSEPLNISLYPADRAALEWWQEERQLESLADATRSVIDVAMTLAKGANWKASFGSTSETREPVAA